MIFNDLHEININNRFQNTDEHKRVLCVCSIGMLRSATMQVVFSREFNFNCRAVGVRHNALVQVSEALVVWADEIVCADGEVQEELFRQIDEHFDEPESTEIKGKVVHLSIPDDFDFMEPVLQNIILDRYKKLSKTT